VPNSLLLAVYVHSVFYGSCCKTDQAVIPQEDPSLLPPAVYIPTPVAVRLGKGRKWSCTTYAYVTHYRVLEINELVCWRLKFTGGLWLTLTEATLGLQLHILHRWRKKVAGPAQSSFIFLSPNPKLE